MTFFDAWNRELGTKQGRIAPSSVQPIAGTYVVCLGFDSPLREEDISPGDFAQVEQLAIPTLNTKLLRVAAIIRPPSTVPAGCQWVVQVLLNDSVKISQTLRPGGKTRVRQFAVNISKTDLSQGAYLTMRLILLTANNKQYITTASYDMGESAGIVVPLGIPSAGAFGVGRVAFLSHLSPTGIASAFASGTATLRRLISSVGIATAYASGTAQLNQKFFPTGIASAYASGSAHVNRTVSPTGIAAAYASGTAKINTIVAPTGIASAEAFGTAAVSTGLDPTTLAMTGLWRDYTGSAPWNGTASAGVSGSQTLSAGTAPAAGTALNGHGTASFNGSTSSLTASGTLDTYANAGAMSGWVLIKPASVSTLQTIWSDSGTDFDLRIQVSGTIRSELNGTSGSAVTVTPTNSVYQLVTFRYDQVHNQIGLNGPPTTTIAFTTALALAGTPGMGSRSGGSFLNATIAEFGITDQILSDAQFNGIKSYINTRYGLSL